VLQRDRRARVKSNECDWTVSAEFARAHLLKLRRAHVGKRAVAAVTGISDLVLMKIANGKQRRIRESTERRIMRVTEDARSGGSLLSAKETDLRIKGLLAAGYSMQELAMRLGYADKYIQFFGCRFVTAHNAMRIEKLYKILMRSDRVERMVSLAEHRAMKGMAA
jgi:hypothetical protein